MYTFIIQKGHKMSRKQEICAVIAAVELLFAAGTIDNYPGTAFALLAAMIIPVVIGKLDKRRVTCADIERRCRNAKN